MAETEKFVIYVVPIEVVVQMIKHTYLTYFEDTPDKRDSETTCRYYVYDKYYVCVDSLVIKIKEKYIKATRENLRWTCAAFNHRETVMRKQQYYDLRKRIDFH